jgi:hypothetical protein
VKKAFALAVVMMIAAAHAEVPRSDAKSAAARVRRAWSNDAPCSGAPHCTAYFESFGAALTFEDGTLVPLAHEQRLRRSSRECIKEARIALARGDRTMAVEWVMAAYSGEPVVRNWLFDHPDAVLEGLRHFND